jgi:hypothetical protein
LVIQVFPLAVFLTEATLRDYDICPGISFKRKAIWTLFLQTMLRANLNKLRERLIERDLLLVVYWLLIHLLQKRFLLISPQNERAHFILESVNVPVIGILQV